MKPIDLCIFAGCLAGLAASLVLAALGVADVRAPLTGAAFVFAKWTLLWILPVGLAFVLRYRHLTYDQTAREVEMWRYNGCPPWMRLTCLALMAAGLALFFTPAVLELMGVIPHGDNSPMPSTVPGGFGIVAFSSIFAQLYSATAKARKVA